MKNQHKKNTTHALHPHEPQNFDPGTISEPHFGQNLGIFSDADGAGGNSDGGDGRSDKPGNGAIPFIMSSGIVLLLPTVAGSIPGKAGEPSGSMGGSSRDSDGEGGDPPIDAISEVCFRISVRSKPQ